MYRDCVESTSVNQAVSRSAGPVDGTQPCVLLMNGDGHVIQASPAAYAMLATCEALRLEGRHIVAASTTEGMRLMAALRSVLTRTSLSRIIHLGQDDSRIEIALVVLDGSDGPRHVIATVKSAVDSRAQAMARVIRQFGLTLSEGRLLQLLCAGASIPEASEKLGVARTTARTHLQRIFDKAGVRRQSDLQRLVFGQLEYA